ncbi:nicotinate-nucleotide--dimethylbenzimidazole phosphoribosyltransferase [Crenothrix sp.]|uniref:nicotinate-nucleotide--dimethylbenzimidazole phosphoribosyltransferase n=1 Tax=Crenothrix sp. TaxID=3100433 RepID=UPI00374DBC08
MSVIFNIPHLSIELTETLQTKIDHKTKPLGALGQLESLALQIGLCQNTLSPQLSQPCLIIFAGDHGIVESGVSAYPQVVTAQMVSNFLAGGAAISVFAKQHNLDLWIVDAGVNADINPHEQLIAAKIAKGTQNFLTQPAMAMTQCLAAMQAGADIILQRYSAGCNCIGFGEMGIANTSSAAMLMQCITAIPLPQCVGRGTGLDDGQLQHKLSILEQAIAHHGTLTDPLTILSTFGGFEIAMMVGAYLKAAELKMLCMVDGFIGTAALLVASKLYANVLDYCVFSHVSNEQGHQALLSYLDGKALLKLDLRLGEGSGIALAYPLVQSAVLFLNDMATFDEAQVAGKNTPL